SGRPGTRLAHRPGREPGPPPSGRPGRAWAPIPHIAPPGRSRLPVIVLRTSVAHDATVPATTVCTPIRPYTAAVPAPANSLAIRRVVSAGICVRSTIDSGV